MPSDESFAPSDMKIAASDRRFYRPDAGSDGSDRRFHRSDVGSGASDRLYSYSFYRARSKILWSEILWGLFFVRTMVYLLPI